MRENADQNNSEYGHILGSEFSISTSPENLKTQRYISIEK